MNYSLSDKDILRAVRGRCNIILYSELKYVPNIDDILRPYGCCVILYEQFPRSGHWVVLTKNNSKNEIEYFNSLGEYPDDFLHIVDDKLKKELNEDYPYLSNLLLKSDYKLAYNQYKLQKQDNNIATCGRWCVLRVLYKKLPLDTFVKMFMNKRESPDEIATRMTYKLI